MVIPVVYYRQVKGTANELPTLTPGVIWGKIKALIYTHHAHTQNTRIHTGWMCRLDKKMSEKMGGN